MAVAHKVLNPLPERLTKLRICTRFDTARKIGQYNKTRHVERSAAPCPAAVRTLLGLEPAKCSHYATLRLRIAAELGKRTGASASRTRLAKNCFHFDRCLNVHHGICIFYDRSISVCIGRYDIGRRLQVVKRRIGDVVQDLCFDSLIGGRLR